LNHERRTTARAALAVPDGRVCAEGDRRARRQQAIADEALKSSRQARQNSDNYVLLTVLFASVLFFGRIARAFDSRVLRTILAGLAVVLFLATLAGLLTVPICHE